MLNLKHSIFQILITATTLISMSATASVQVIHDISFPESTTASPIIDKCNQSDCSEALAKAK